MSGTPALPRLVEQLRILLWMQMHLLLIALVVILAAIGLAADRTGYTPSERVGIPLVAGFGWAILLAVGAALLKRRTGGWLFVLLVAIEVLFLGAVVALLALDIAPWVAGLILIAVTAWILADLARREVRDHLWRRQPALAAQ